MTDYRAKWADAELGDLVTVCRPRSDPRDFQDLPFVGMDNVEAHTMRLLGTVPARTMRSNAIHFFPKDVLYGRLRPYLNKVLAATFEGLASAEFIPLTPEQGVDSDFVRYRLNAADFVSFTSHLDEGDRPRVDWEGIRQFPVPLPPSAEQRRIVAAIDSYLTRLDDAIANLERVQAKLKAYRASVLKAAVEGRLVPTEAFLTRAQKRDYEPAEVLLAGILNQRRRRWEETELIKLKAAGKTPKDDKWKAKYTEPVTPDTSTLPELPEGWTWARISSVGEVQLGRQRAPIHHLGRHMRPYLRVANVFEDRIDTADVMTMNFTPQEFKTYCLGFGDILLNEGQSPHLIGRPAMYRDEVPGACFQNTLIRFRASSGVDPRFALVVFRAQLHARRYMRIAQITTNIAHLGAGRFAEIEFPLPPTEEQRRIADEVERLMSIANSVEAALSHQQGRATRLRQSILKWAFGGRLVDQDPNDEPAERLLASIRAERAAAAPIKQSRGHALNGAT